MSPAEEMREGQGVRDLWLYMVKERRGIDASCRLLCPVRPAAMSLGGTMQGVARCKNREFYYTAPEDFEIIFDHLGEMSSAYNIRVFAYSLMSNRIHVLLQAPAGDVLARPLRWFMTETAGTFHRIRNRSGQFWERR